MADQQGGSPAAVPDDTNWSDWTYALALRAVTGDDVDLRTLSQAQWFVFDPSSVDRPGGSGEVGYQAYDNQYYASTIDHQAVGAFESAVDQLDVIAGDLGNGARGAMDISTLAALRDKVARLEAFLSDAGGHLRKWANDLGSAAVDLSGTAAGVIRSRLDKEAGRIELWSERLPVNPTLPLSTAVENARSDLNNFRIGMANAWHNEAIAGLRGRIQAAIDAETSAIHDYLVSQGLVAGTPGYKFDKSDPTKQPNLVVTPTMIQGFHDDTRTQILAALAGYPKGDLRQPETWMRINQSVTDSVRASLDNLDATAQHYIEPLRGSYMTLGSGLKPLGALPRPVASPPPAASTGGGGPGGPPPGGSGGGAGPGGTAHNAASQPGGPPPTDAPPAGPSPDGAGGAGAPPPDGSAGAFPPPGGTPAGGPAPDGSGGAFPPPGGTPADGPAPDGSGGALPPPGGTPAGGPVPVGPPASAAVPSETDPAGPPPADGSAAGAAGLGGADSAPPSTAPPPADGSAPAGAGTVTGPEPFPVGGLGRGAGRGREQKKRRRADPPAARHVATPAEGSAPADAAAAGHAGSHAAPAGQQVRASAVDLSGDPVRTGHASELPVGPRAAEFSLPSWDGRVGGDGLAHAAAVPPDAGQQADYRGGAFWPAGQYGPLSTQVAGSPVPRAGARSMPYPPPMGSTRRLGSSRRGHRDRTRLTEDEKVWGLSAAASAGVVGLFDEPSDDEPARAGQRTDREETAQIVIGRGRGGDSDDEFESEYRYDRGQP
jgi:hypothetical protein